MEVEGGTIGSIKDLSQTGTQVHPYYMYTTLLADLALLKQLAPDPSSLCSPMRQALFTTLLAALGLVSSSQPLLRLSETG